MRHMKHKQIKHTQSIIRKYMCTYIKYTAQRNTREVVWEHNPDTYPISSWLRYSTIPIRYTWFAHV